MAARRVPYVTPEEYLERERRAEFRSEYRGGEIVAMSGASEAHNQINANLGGLLYNALRGTGCRHCQNNMRVAIRRGTRFVYPDTLVVCGERRFTDDVPDTLTNPTLIIEVLSESTEAYDRGEKFLWYQQIESLREYVLVAQMSYTVERFVREGDHWRYVAVSGPDAVVTLESVGVTLQLSDIYEGVAAG
jgi:Uma2 family endonuclease